MRIYAISIILVLCLGCFGGAAISDSKESTKKVLTQCLNIARVSAGDVNHQPDQDVLYEPGMTVDGQPVVPGEVVPSLKITTDQILIPITLDIARFLELPITDGFLPEAIVGFVRVDGHEIYFNDIRLTPDQSSALQSYCDKLKMQHSE